MTTSSSLHPKDLLSALQASESTNRAMLEAIPDLLLRLQRDGTCLDYINPGIELGNFLPIANHISEVLPPELLQKQLQIIEQAIATGKLQVYEHSFLKQGCRIHEEVRILAINDQEVLTIIRDISDRKQSEEALRLSEERLQLALGIAGDGLWDWNITTGDLYVSPRWLEMLGFEADELPADISTWERLVHPEDKPWVMAKLNAHFQYPEVPYKFEYRVQTKTGDYCWISNYGKVFVRDDRGQPLRMIGTQRDISVRKQSEEQLRKSDAHLKTAQRIGKLGSWEFELQTGQISWSEEVFRIYGRDPALGEPTYEELRQYFHPEDWEHFDQIFQTSITLAQPYDSEHRICRPDGALLYVIIRGEIICNTLGETLKIVGTVIDVTALKQAETALRQLNQELEYRVERRTASLQQSEARLREAQQVARLGDWKLDLLNQTTIWSPEVFRIFGLDPNQPEPTYEEMLQYYPLDERKRVIDLVNRAFQGEPYEADLQIIRADGSSVYTFAKAEPIWDAAGKVSGLFGIMMDISDRKCAEQENQRLKERLRFVLSVNPAVIFTCKPNADYGATFISDNVQRIFGYTPAEFTSDSSFWSDHVHPDDVPLVFAELPQIIAQGQLIHEYRFRHQDGYYLLLRSELRLVKDPQGTPSELVGFLVDISDRKAVEIALEKSQSRFRRLAENIPGMVYRYELHRDGSDGLTYVSPVIRDIFELEPADAIGNIDLFRSRIHPEDMPLVKTEITASAENLEPFYLEYRIITPSHGLKWVQSISRPEPQENGDIFWDGVMLDISDRKLAEAQLQQTNNELSRATRQKDEFLANMSHELRTPLNAILGMTESLQEQVFGKVNDEQIKALQTVERSGAHLLELIDDILDMAKIEAGQINLECTPISISYICQSSLAFIKQQALQKRIQVEIKIQPNLPELLVDERRIRQVLINLLNNAFKFTPEGGSITLEVTKICSDRAPVIPSQPCFVSIAVIDTGIGIAPENLKRLFHPFVQIDGALNRKYNGTGLGLALVKKIVELHGGSVGLSSELGVGSCFTVKLPCAPSCNLLPRITLGDPKLESVSANLASQGLILLADDDEANISTLSSYLKAKGYRILVAKNGEEAIALAKAHQPDLILMDIQMPVMDGLEATKQIRLDPNLIDIPIISLTALAMTGDRESCLAAGATDYLTKPVKLKQLVNTIHQLLTLATK